MKKYCSERDIKFLLNEVHNISEVTGHEYFKESSGKNFVGMTLKAALDLSDNLLLPIFTEMDRNQPELVNGTVIVHEKVRDIMREAGEGGWIAAGFPAEYGGFQMPQMLLMSCVFIQAASNYSASVYPMLTTGAAGLLINFGTEFQKKNYLPKMLSGEWQGTMALTEPEAGSSLADLTTIATPDPSGEFYKITGQKIFISAGDHTGVDNVVHLLLAKIPGAPPGVKGISLFMVPKLRLTETGELEDNDVTAAEIFHKLGYRGCPITKLNYGDKGDCRGYLVGTLNMGLAHMFQMMNESRIGVGIGAAAISTAAYYAALDYTQERKQGRPLGGKDPAQPQVAIIEHPDIKRMLLYQKSVVEGALSLLICGAKYIDLEHVSEGEEKKRMKYLQEILMPVFKSYSSEKGILCTSNALQCFGGYGYCEDFPVEQLYRDVRIHPIHEGTTGIQALDLLGRKVTYDKGAAFMIFCEEVEKAIAAAKPHAELARFAADLEVAMERLKTVTAHIFAGAKDKPSAVLMADATLYLDMFSTIVIAWQWLLQGPAILAGLGTSSKKEKNFYTGKLAALKFYFLYELNNIYALERRLLNGDTLLNDLMPEHLDI